MHRSIASISSFTLLLIVAIGSAAENTSNLSARIERLRSNPLAQNAWIADWERTASSYHLIVIDPAFGALPAPQQLEALRAAAYHAYRARRFGTAWELAAQTSDRADSSEQDLLLRLHAGAAIGSWQDAANTLDVLAGRYPSSLSAINPDYLTAVLSAFYFKDRQRYFRFAQKLFGSGYRYYGVMEPDEVWRELVVHMVEQGNLDTARRVANRILNARLLIDLRADRSTEKLLDAHPFRGRFRDALRTQLAQARRLVAEHPHDSLPFSLYADLLKLGGLDKEILDSTAALLKEREGGDPNRPAFDDGSSAQWIHNARAYAMRRLNRPQDALDEMQRGSAMLESGHTNTSQNLNLARMQCDAGKFEQARETLARTGKMSPYGQMVYWRISLCIAQGLKDTQQIAAAMEYVRAHGDDSPGGLIDSLLEVGAIDEASAALINGLKNSESRASLLSDLQDVQTHRPADGKKRKYGGQWQELVDRADVRAVIEEVGHIYSYDLSL